MKTNQAPVPLRLLAAVDQMPAEGFESEADAGENQSQSLLDAYVSALAESAIGFDVSAQGIRPLGPAARDGVFQNFEASDSATDSGQAVLAPAEDAYEVNFDVLLEGRGGWDTDDLNDACEPADFVRRFLEIVGPALDDEAEIEFTGRHVPLIRWTKKPKSDSDGGGHGAIIQLLGILQTDAEQFEAYCSANTDDFTLIHEDSQEDDEVEGRGLRDVALRLAILGVSVAATPEAEAGLFDKLFNRNDDGQTRERDERRGVRRTEARVAPSTDSWVDAHNDAKINHKLLKSAAESGAARKVVVDIGKQRAYLLIGDQIAIDTPVSTARSGKYTPRGTFTITQRVRSGKTSTIYGCSLPYWMRLDSSAIGMHIGDLPGYPASAGCIRLPYSVAPYMFDATASGTTVQVVDSWAGPSSGRVVVADAS